MESKHKNIDQLDGNTSMDSDTVCKYCKIKSKKKNTIEVLYEEDDDDSSNYLIEILHKNYKYY